MQIIKPNSRYDFVGKNRLALTLSLLVLLAGLISLAFKGGPSYGVDFSGGTLVQVRFATPITTEQIQLALAELTLGQVTVQQFGDSPREYLIRTPQAVAGMNHYAQRIEAALKAQTGDQQLEVMRSEVVGPQVGQELRNRGVLALCYALLGTLAYISWRFEYRFGVAAMVALAHDVLITLGLFSLFDKELDLTIVAALLTIIGYSLNDTIIIFDRIRENQRQAHEEPFAATLNRSINETLSRTILTSGTTLLVVMALYLLGGAVIHNFAFALLVGILVGTYSSVYIASALLLLWETRRPLLVRNTEKIAGRSTLGESIVRPAGQ